MNPTDIIAKTAAGVDELKTRARKLPQRLRTVLILIDGVLNVGQIRHAASGLGLPPDFLEGLERDGLVQVREVRQPTPSRPAPLTTVDIPTHDGPPVVAGDAGSEAEAEKWKFQKAQTFMSDGVVSALGFRAFFFTMKLEACYTRADLAALLPDFQKAIAKGNGDEIARILVGRAREMLR